MTKQLIIKALKRYDRIFKNTVMWKEQRSFLQEELQNAIDKSVDDGNTNEFQNRKRI